MSAIARLHDDSVYIDGPLTTQSLRKAMGAFLDLMGVVPFVWFRAEVVPGRAERKGDAIFPRDYVQVLAVGNKWITLDLRSEGTSDIDISRVSDGVRWILRMPHRGAPCSTSQSRHIPSRKV
jgi:hypothetical protein